MVVELVLSVESTYPGTAGAAAAATAAVADTMLAMMPCDEAYVPGGQDMQEIEPLVAVYNPLGQSKQVVFPAMA